MQLKLILLAVLTAIVFVAVVWWFTVQKKLGEQELNTTGSSTVSGPSAVSSGSDGEQLPGISLTDYDGNAVRLAEFSGRPLVINSWAVWCPFCVKELPDFATVQKEFGDRVTIVAIDRAESRDVVKEFTNELGITEDLIFLLDPSDSFYRAIGGFSMPETIFVKADGTIHFHKRGPMTREEIRQRTQELVQ